MAKGKKTADDHEEDVLETIMVAVGLVLASKPGFKPDIARDRECAVNVLASLEDDGFSVVRNAHRT